MNNSTAGTNFKSRIGEIVDVLKTGETAAVIYRSILHYFGRKDGLPGYQKLKG